MHFWRQLLGDRTYSHLLARYTGKKPTGDVGSTAIPGGTRGTGSNLGAMPFVCSIHATTAGAESIAGTKDIGTIGTEGIEGIN